jgi:nicotinamidase-related amidase
LSGDATQPATRYVLLTECLQNDFFLNKECRLSLPDHILRSMLLRRADFELDLGTGSRRRIPSEAIERGPLGLFFDGVMTNRPRDQDGVRRLDVINIRDWHECDPNYDAERRTYGPHCEADTWGAAYVEGFERYLDPGGDGRTHTSGSVTIHHVLSDSVFDFKPQAENIAGTAGKLDASELQDILDEIVDKPDRVYVGIVGVYTDIKIKTLLTGLRTRYSLTNLAVSDTFTASPTLERHLAGLDFAKKVLDVEVIHGINDFVRFLGGPPDLQDEADIVTSDGYSRYQSFFQDQQNVLAYQRDRLEEYKLLTARRSVKVYKTIERSNVFLQAWGSLFLATTLVLSILSAFVWVKWEVPAVTGGLTLAQFVGVFFRTSGEDMQKNLTNLAVFSLILESHSLKVALARFHLTTAQTLRAFETPGEATAARRQICALSAALRVIQRFDKSDFEDIERLGFRADSPIDLKPATDGAAADGAEAGAKQAT